MLSAILSSLSRIPLEIHLFTLRQQPPSGNCSRDIAHPSVIGPMHPHRASFQLLAPSLRPPKLNRPASLHSASPHANLVSEACAMTKRSRHAGIQPQKPMLRKSSTAPRHSPLVPARSQASACPPIPRRACAPALERLNRNCPGLEIVANGSIINALQILIASQKAVLEAQVRTHEIDSQVYF